MTEIEPAVVVRRIKRSEPPEPAGRCNTPTEFSFYIFPVAYFVIRPATLPVSNWSKGIPDSSLFREVVEYPSPVLRFPVNLYIITFSFEPAGRCYIPTEFDFYIFPVAYFVIRPTALPVSNWSKGSHDSAFSAK